MKAKEYLQQLRRMDTAINQKLREQQDLRALAAHVPAVGYAGDRVQGGRSGGAPYVDAVHRLLDLEAEINREIDTYADRKHEIIGQIQALGPPQYAEILYKRYVEFKSLEEIAGEMHYAYGYVRSLHGRALQEFERSYTILH